jgi:hypothetical protein
MADPVVCPRCGGTEFTEIEVGNDTWDSYSRNPTNPERRKSTPNTTK